MWEDSEGDMKQRRAIVLVTTALLVAPMSARAQEYQLPQDPVSPMSRSECKALLGQYLSIAKNVAEQAKSSGNAAWQIVLQMNGSNYKSSSLYARSQKLYDDAFKIRGDGSKAYVRCLRQVAALEASLAEERRAESKDGTVPSDGPKGYAAMLGDIVADTTPAKALSDMYRKVSEVGNILSALSDRGGFEGYMGQATNGISGTTGRSTARTFMTQASLGQYFGVNEAASAAYQGKSAALDGPSGIGDLVSHARAEESALIEPSAPVAGMSVQDNFSEDVLQAYRDHQGMYVGRGKAYEEALATVQREYKKTKRRTAKPKTARRSGSDGRKYSATQCGQILAQIQHLRSILPAYSAAGQGGPILTTIQGNQREYNSGCR